MVIWPQTGPSPLPSCFQKYEVVVCGIPRRVWEEQTEISIAGISMPLCPGREKQSNIGIARSSLTCYCQTVREVRACGGRHLKINKHTGAGAVRQSSHAPVTGIASMCMSHVSTQLKKANPNNGKSLTGKHVLRVLLGKGSWHHLWGGGKKRKGREKKTHVKWWNVVLPVKICLSWCHNLHTPHYFHNISSTKYCGWHPALCSIFLWFQTWTECLEKFVWAYSPGTWKCVYVWGNGSSLYILHFAVKSKHGSTDAPVFYICLLLCGGFDSHPMFFKNRHAAHTDYLPGEDGLLHM